MNKSAFLDQPYHWTRTPRTSQTLAELACPIQGHIEQHMSGPARAIAWGLVALLCLLLAVHWLA